MEIKEYLKNNFIKYTIDSDGKIVVGFWDLRKGIIPNIKNCKITGSLWLDNLTTLDKVDDKDFLLDCEIYGDLDLDSLECIPEGFLRNIKIGGDLYLHNILYLPRGFNVHVKGEIYLDSLKSEVLQKLLIEPGIKRQLGFNLLR